MKKTGWIIVNGNLTTNKFIDYAEMIQSAAQKRHMDVSIIKNNEILLDLSDRHPLGLHRQTYTLPDFVFFIDKDIYLAKYLEQLGIPVFNSSATIEMSDDKIQTYQKLTDIGIPIPHTIIAPKIYSTGILSDDYLQSIIHKLGLPLIVKEAFGSFGEQVYLVHEFKELKKLTNQLQGKPYLFQSYISSSHGRDLRLQVVGDKIIAGMERNNDQDFRANITNGGNMKPFTPDQKATNIAIAAAQAINADFAGVDLLFGQEDSYLVCEINANAHIRNLTECTSVDIADEMITYIEGKIR
ncbi:RimK family alpha-L-glutamate ligase [Oceanobacillus sp. 1P07AA]|uniref:RimK family alpha-L-glutamate ligase n=1 Tax=Oceanobacillus sp. 1P07AA TaxID=3132293 RepID=UPI0039A776C0